MYIHASPECLQLDSLAVFCSVIIEENVVVMNSPDCLFVDRLSRTATGSRYRIIRSFLL
jgi:hypothetical protein